MDRLLAGILEFGADIGLAADVRGAAGEIARGMPVQDMRGSPVRRGGELADVEMASPRLVVSVLDEQRVGNRWCRDRAGEQAAAGEARNERRRRTKKE